MSTDILQRDSQSPVGQSYEYFLCDPYAPSTKTLGQLETITISELRIGVHHQNKVLYARLIDSALRFAAVQGIVEDEKGSVERLALYNTDPDEEAQDVLPENAILAIKEPFFWEDANGKCIIRIDHPSDVIILNRMVPGLPKGLTDALFDAQCSTLEWKTRGNAAYASRKYHAANYSYTRGIESCQIDETSLMFDILRNRSIVNLYLGRYEQALADAEAAIIPTDAKDPGSENKMNMKAYERAGLAASFLGRLDRATDYFRRMKALSSVESAPLQALERVERLKLEASTGKYDFMRMSESCSKKHNRLDHANFISNTTVHDTERHGRGLFATKNIAAGDLIMVEKALNVSFSSDMAKHSFTILNPNTQRALTGSQAKLQFSLTQLLLHSPEHSNAFSQLFDGTTHPLVTQKVVDGLVPVDTFRVERIIEHNAFECPTVRSSNQQSQDEATSTAGSRSTGLWVRASYINHACDGNAMRSFIGDMMIIRAVRDISKNEEILMPYRIPNARNKATQDILRTTFGFNCDCRICVAEASISVRQHQHRVHLLERCNSLLSNYPATKEYLGKRSVVSKMESIVSKLNETYFNEKFERVPRLGLIPPVWWLCRAYRFSGNYRKVIQTATDLLRYMGFIVMIDDHSVAIKRDYCQLDGIAIDAAMHLAFALRSQGNKVAWGPIEDFAKSLYLTMYGEMRGFNDRYQEELLNTTDK